MINRVSTAESTMRQQRYLCESTVRCSIDRSDCRSQESAGDSATMDEFSRQVPNHSGDSSARNNTAHKQTPKQQRRQPRQCEGMRNAVGGHQTPAGLSEPPSVADRPIRCTAGNLRGWMLIGAGSVHRTAFGCDATDGRSSERCFRCFREERTAPDGRTRTVDDVRSGADVWRSATTWSRHCGGSRNGPRKTSRCAFSHSVHSAHSKRNPVGFLPADRCVVNWLKPADDEAKVQLEDNRERDPHRRTQPAAPVPPIPSVVAACSLPTSQSPHRRAVVSLWALTTRAHRLV